MQKRSQLPFCGPLSQPESVNLPSQMPTSGSVLRARRGDVLTSEWPVTRPAIRIGPPDCIHAGFAEYRRHLPIRLPKPGLDPYSMRVWLAEQKLPAPAAALRWQKVQAHPDQTGLLQTERNAANGMRPRPQANPSHSQQPQAWRRNSG